MKYLGEIGFYSYKSSNSSQFWISLLEVKEWCSRGLAYVLGNGKKICFWHDVWIEGCPLKICFPNLFDICNQQDWFVHRILVGVPLIYPLEEFLVLERKMNGWSYHKF